MGKHDHLDPAYELYQPEREPSSKLKPVLLIVGIIAAISLVAGAGTAYWLNSSLSNIKRIGVTVDDENRPQPTGDGGLNILMLGADAGDKRNGPGTSIVKDATKADWPTGKYRSDATMLVHIDADREHAYVVSIPRDSYVPIHDQTGEKRDTTKINAALSIYGPSGALSTVENFSGQRIDHIAMVDWDGFKAITDAVGGVTVTVRGQGKTKMNGEEALDYVGERKKLPNGDFDRAKRQQNFLRALLTKVIERGTLYNPIKLKRTLDSMTKNVAVDDGWSTGAIRSLALTMRDIKPRDVTFLTIPTDGTDSDPIAGSIVVVDEAACQDLFDAMAADEMGAWVDANGKTKLGRPDDVN